MKQPPVSNNGNAQLLTIVEVERDLRVRCGNPGCGHSVHKAIHVVRDGAEVLVLGSTCFNKRYGSNALGKPSYGGGGGRKLTAEERELLLNNTTALVERFRVESEAQRQKLRDMRSTFEARAYARRMAPTTMPVPPVRLSPGGTEFGLGAMKNRQFPWPWMKPMSSIAAFQLHDGSGWVRVQRREGQQMLVPFPKFDGWDEWLPAHLGCPDIDFEAYQIHDIPAVVAYLRARSAHEKISGVWAEVEAFFKRVAR